MNNIAQIFYIIYRFRYPVPDSYTITLEIYRDRTTAMRKCKGYAECQSSKGGMARSLNQPCKQMVLNNVQTIHIHYDRIYNKTMSSYKSILI